MGRVAQVLEQLHLELGDEGIVVARRDRLFLARGIVRAARGGDDRGQVAADAREATDAARHVRDLEGAQQRGAIDLQPARHALAERTPVGPHQRVVEIDEERFHCNRKPNRNMEDDSYRASDIRIGRRRRMTLDSRRSSSCTSGWSKTSPSTWRIRR